MTDEARDTSHRGRGARSVPGSAHADAASCDSLARLALDNAKITIAQDVAAGAFTPPGPARQGGAAPQQPRAFATLPAFCRVAATLTPSSDSDIKIEVWLPAKWNGKFQAVGNGGWAGVISYTALATAVAAGYATASTDTGHVGGTGAFALGHPEKVIDFGYRSVHEMTVKAKAVIDAFYGARPTLSIWNGCSQGGRQGITEAVRYPADFDAIVAGAPAVNWIHLHAGSHGDQSRCERDTGEHHPALEIPGHLSRRARRVRRARRRGRRRDRESGRLHLRSEGAAVFGCRGRGVPHAGAGRLGADDVRRRDRIHRRGRGAARPRARIGAGLERHRRRGADRLRRRRLQVRDREGSRLGRLALQSRHRSSTAHRRRS